MPKPKCEFQIKTTAGRKLRPDDDDAFAIDVLDARGEPIAAPCVVKVYVNGRPPELHEPIGGLQLTGQSTTYFSFKATDRHPSGKITVTVSCPDCALNEQTVRLPVPGESVPNPATGIGGFVDDFERFLKKIADVLDEGIDKLIPKQAREVIAKIKELVGKGLGLLSNVLQDVPLTVPPGLTLPKGLAPILEKIVKQLKEHDPIDDSKEAVMADAAALKALIEEDIIPFVREVGAAALRDLEHYNWRLSVMRKIIGRLSYEVTGIEGPAQRKKPGK